MKRRVVLPLLCLLVWAHAAKAQPPRATNLKLHFYPLQCIVHCPELGLTDREVREGQELRAEPGTYEIKFRVADIELSKTLEVTRGKKYTLYADFESEIVLDLSHVYGKDTTPTRPGKYDEPPKVVRHQPAHYPERARQLGIEGNVMVQVYVSADGSVEDVALLSGVHPLLDLSALDSAREITFRPAKLNGTNVPGYIWVPIEFTATSPR